MKIILVSIFIQYLMIKMQSTREKYRWLVLGCQVINNTVEYYQILNMLKDQQFISYCLIKEF